MRGARNEEHDHSNNFNFFNSIGRGNVLDIQLDLHRVTAEITARLLVPTALLEYDDTKTMSDKKYYITDLGLHRTNTTM